MRISNFYLLLSVIAMAIIGYLAYYIAHTNNDHNDIIVGIGTAISVISTLGAGISISHGSSKVNVNMKVLCLVSFVLLMIVNFCYAGFGVSMPYYVIVIGLLLIIFVGFFKKIADINDI